MASANINVHATPRLVLNQARSFLIAADRCEEQRPDSIDPSSFEAPLIPAVVCHAFATELAFKGLLLCATPGQLQRGHDLLDLAALLGATVENEIATAAGMSPQDFKSKLTKHRQAFQDFRYLHEVSALSADLDFLRKISEAAVTILKLRVGATA